MSVELWIDDGEPWYLSPDIWVVPGDDPNGTAGVPIVGSPAYVWANVHNRGTSSVLNARVRFYWANPSTMITRATATLVGTSYVSLNPGETKAVLCVAPWLPSWISNGHECLIVEAFHPADPLPPYGDNDPFNPSGDRHVAQRNIIVLLASSLAVFPFTIGNVASLHVDKITLCARRAPLNLLAKLKGSLGLESTRKELAEIREFGLIPFRCGDQVKEVGKPKCSLRVEAGKEDGAALVINVTEDFASKAGALFLIEQLHQEKVVGGIGVVVVPKASKTQKKRNRRRN